MLQIVDINTSSNTLKEVERLKLNSKNTLVRPVREGTGIIISNFPADSFAESEYSKFRVIQDREYKSNFTKVIDEIKTANKFPYSEEQSEPDLNEFDKNLKGLLNTPPPKKEEKE